MSKSGCWLSAEIATEVGDNWSVFYFECPKDKLEWLIDLFHHVAEIKGAELPHFTIREYSLQSKIGVSLRVLRDQSIAKDVDADLVNFFKIADVHYQKDPESNRHAWIRKGETDPEWNKSRCDALFQLSRFVIFLAEQGMFDTNSKCHFAHCLINMLALQEATKANSNEVSFLDVINERSMSFQTCVL